MCIGGLDRRTENLVNFLLEELMKYVFLYFALSQGTFSLYCHSYFAYFQAILFF